MKDGLSHLNQTGEAHMVDVSDKAITTRTASAQAIVSMSQSAFDTMLSGNAKKGDVLGTARLAGIMAAKKTSDLIPLCHPLPISKVTVTLDPKPDVPSVLITATVKTEGKTGVEMEALTAASVSALTLYDMLKAVDKAIVISNTQLVSKIGGKSGDFKRGIL